MDTLAASGVAEITLMKAGQMAGSEAVRSYLGWRMEHDPCPSAYVLPTRKKLNEVFAEDILTMFSDTAPLARILSPRHHEITKERVKLINNATLHGIWAGTPLESFPYGLVILDELDRYPPPTGKDNDTVGQASVRVATFGARGRLVRLGTPATRYHATSQAFEAADHRFYYHVPCPHCGAFIRLVFPQLKWPSREELGITATEAQATPEAAADPPDAEPEVDAPALDLDGRRRQAELIRTKRLAWYECQACGGGIEDQHRKAMVNAGRWSTEDGAVPDAELVEAWPDGTKLGFQIGGLYAVWPGFTWSLLAAEFLLAQHDRNKLFDFRTLREGLPFEERIHRFTANVFVAKSRRTTLAEGLVPRWATRLLATVDTQADHFYVVVRAWAGLRSQRVWHGIVRDFKDVDRICYQTLWRVEGEAFTPQRVYRTAIDTGGTGSRTMECYSWCLPRKRWVVPIKIANSPISNGALFAPGTGWFRRHRLRKGKASGVPIPLYLVDGHQCHDILADAISAGIPPAEAVPGPQTEEAVAGDDVDETWLLNARIDPQYNEHMANLQKVVTWQGSKAQLQWVEQSPGARHDYRECEAYQFFLVYLLGMDQETAETHQRWRTTQEHLREERARSPLPNRREDDVRDDPWRPKDWSGLLR